MNTDYNSGASAVAALPPLLISLVIAVLTIIAMWKVFTKAGEPGWASIVPFYNIYVEFRIGGLNPWLFLLMLIPLVNVVVWILVMIRTGAAFGKNAVWSIFLLAVFPTIGLMILAFGSATYDRSRIV